YLCGPNVVEERNNTINNPSRAIIEDGPNSINGPQPVEEPPLEEFETVIGGEGAASGGEDFSGNVEEEVDSVENLNGGEGADEEEVALEVASSESDLDELLEENDSELMKRPGPSEMRGELKRMVPEGRNNMKLLVCL
ncbi:hypothetical protein A4A49_58728, partial [Nicotiana attenuata]